MRTSIAAASLLALALSSSSYAQDTIQSSDTDFYAQTSGGTPLGCGFGFTIVYVDHTYREGALEAVQGSLTWAEMRPGLGMMLKIVGKDFTFPQGTPRPAPFSVLQGFLAVDGESILPTKVLGCEQSTAFCATYKFADAAKVYKAIVLHQNLTVGFNRQPNGLDITLPLDTAVTGAKANQFASYNACIQSITERAEKNFEISTGEARMGEGPQNDNRCKAISARRVIDSGSRDSRYSFRCGPCNLGCCHSASADC